jgi:hypothetical protein
VVLSHLDIYTFWLTDIRPNNAKNLFCQIFLKSYHFVALVVSREILELTHIFRHSWYHLFLNKGMSRSTLEGGFSRLGYTPNKESTSFT